MPVAEPRVDRRGFALQVFLSEQVTRTQRRSIDGARREHRPSKPAMVSNAGPPNTKMSASFGIPAITGCEDPS